MALEEGSEEIHLDMSVARMHGILQKTLSLLDILYHQLQLNKLPNIIQSVKLGARK